MSFICPECQRLGLTSEITKQGRWTRHYPGINVFVDPDGTFHHHEYSFYKQPAVCSHQHLLELNWYNQCPHCDYNANSERAIFIATPPSELTVELNNLT